MRFPALICAFIFAGSHSVAAMQFNALPANDQGNVAITATGEIVDGDWDRLRVLVQHVSATLPRGGQIDAILLDSPGGKLVEAEQLAALFQKLHVAVVLPPGSQCDSACFLLFAAGARRVIAPDALVGVHSASREGHETAASMAVTTLMARDAADMGVPPQIVGKMVTTTPDRMAWLTRDDLALMNVRIFDPGNTPAPAPQPPPIVSNIPATSLPAMAPAPPPVGTLSLPPLEQFARQFASVYFANWSASNITAMTYISNVYADTVDFYGGAASRQTVVDLKRKFAERWPARTYTVRPNSVHIDCDQGASTCVATGLVDWDCRDAGRGAHSAGLASFTLKVVFNQLGVAEVTGESGSVVSRSSAR